MGRGNTEVCKAISKSYWQIQRLALMAIWWLGFVFATHCGNICAILLVIKTAPNKKSSWFIMACKVVSSTLIPIRLKLAINLIICLLLMSRFLVDRAVLQLWRYVWAKARLYYLMSLRISARMHSRTRYGGRKTIEELSFAANGWRHSAFICLSKSSCRVTYK